MGRGTPGPYSDTDVLLVAEPLPAGRLRRMEDFSAVEVELGPALEAAARAGCYTTVSPVFKTPAEVASGSLLFLDMIEDARLLIDRGAFFPQHLSAFAQRLSELGARRIRRGSSWHWDLKPDYERGEVFQL